MLGGHFQYIGVSHDNALPYFQVLQFFLHFRILDVDGFRLARRVFESHLVFLQVDASDFQLHLDLTSGRSQAKL